MSNQQNISSDAIRALVNADQQVHPTRFTVDIIADFVCPWSFIGWRRLAKASEAVQGGLTRNWYPFQLNPDMPAEGLAFDEYLASRFGDVNVLRPVLDELARLGAEEGIRFNFDKIEQVPNSLQAHCLVREAAASGLADQTADRLFRATFELGEDIGSPKVLQRIAEEIGLQPQHLEAALNADSQTAETVAREEKMVRHAGVTGVPNFLLNKRVFVVGAQNTTQMLNAIDRAVFGDPTETPPLH